MHQAAVFQSGYRPLQHFPCPPFHCRTYHLLSTLRLLSWPHWTKTWGVIGSRLEEATKCPTFLLQQAGKFCFVHVSLGQHHTPRLCLSGSSVCWWGRSLGWQGPFPQILPSSKTKYYKYFIWNHVLFADVNLQLEAGTGREVTWDGTYKWFRLFVGSLLVNKFVLLKTSDCFYSGITLLASQYTEHCYPKKLERYYFVLLYLVFCNSIVVTKKKNRKR